MEQENYRKNQYEQAKQELEKNRSTLGNAELCIKLQAAGIAAKRADLYEEAIAYYKESITINPNNGSAYYALGKTLYLAQKFEQAQKAYVLAYLNHANVWERDLFQHLGHAILDMDLRYQERNKNEIEEYAKSLAGKFASYTSDYQKYDKQCYKKGKDAFPELKRKYEEEIL